MARYDSNTLPIIPLPRNKVFLPGANQRIDVRSIGPLLSSIYERPPVDRPGSAPSRVQVICVPVSSSAKGRNVPRNGEHQDGAEADEDMANIQASDLFGFGVSARVVGIEEMEHGNGAVLKVQGVARCRIKAVSDEGQFFEATDYEHCPDQVPVKDRVLRELFGTLKTKSIQLASIFRVSSVFRSSEGKGWLSPALAGQLLMIIMKKEPKDAGLLADFMTNILNPTHEEKLQILAAVNVKTRLQLVIDLLQRETSELSTAFNITTLTTVPTNKVGKNRAIGPGGAPMSLTNMMPPSGFNPGGEDDSKGPSEIEVLQKKLEAAKLPPDARKLVDREIKHLKNMMPGGNEYSVTVNWLETLAEVPWSIVTNERLGPDTLIRARKQLDDDHYGLEKVKKRLVEYLAVLRLKQAVNDEIEEQIRLAQEEDAKVKPRRESEGEASDQDKDKDKDKELPGPGPAKVELLKAKRSVDRPPILLLAGPPGVGKTSLAKSVATALGRKFHRISLGGVRDEPEIRGHRRTYVSAMPGVIVQGLKKVGVANPVILLDEIDKLGKASNMGDPSAAMLEVLDPEQNHTFTDHYLGTPLDLSKCLFIASANNLETIPAPLLDRMETIYLPGYTTLEKRHIAMRHLVPKQIRANGLSRDQVIFSEDVVSRIIESYTRESGVRNLEREIGSVCRAKAVEYSEARDSGRLDGYRAVVTPEDLEDVLGIEKFEEEIAEKSSRPGIVTGLVAYSSGGNGSILFIEVADMPGDGHVQLTGRLGDVLKESVEVALTWVKAHAYELGLTRESTTNIMEGRSIHVHCPSGSIPKDGPSSGIAQAIALISLFSGNAVPPTMAMTGEISLRGRVTAVGGIKEKLIGALRAGVKTVLLPAQNRKDLRDLPPEVTNGLKILFVGHIWEAIRLVWPNSRWAVEKQLAGIETQTRL